MYLYVIYTWHSSFLTFWLIFSKKSLNTSRKILEELASFYCLVTWCWLLYTIRREDWGWGHWWYTCWVGLRLATIQQDRQACWEPTFFCCRIDRNFIFPRTWRGMLCTPCIWWLVLTQRDLHLPRWSNRYLFYLVI